MKEYFFDEDGDATKIGSIHFNQDYANTLRSLSKFGSDYFYKGELAGCVISDFLEGSISMVYSFYSEMFLKNSFGKYVILDHFRLAKDFDMDYVYLGYWVEGSTKMEYKNSFNSSEVLIDNKWTTI